MEETNDTIYEIQEVRQERESVSEVSPAPAETLPEASQEREAVPEGSSAPAEPLPEAHECPETPGKSELASILESSSEEEVLSLIKKGRSYDEDVAMAEARGEIAGRNAKIESLLDSVAADRHSERNLSSGLSAGREIRSIFDLADLA